MLSDAEWKVMNGLWRRRRATARELLEDVAARTGWAYTTIKTILSRLVDKGVLREAKQGNTSVYEPLLSRRAARRAAVRHLLDHAFDGAFGPLMQHLLQDEKLSRRDRAALRAMLETSGKRGKA
jgi:BlaI family penicillinase repressor